MNIQFTSSYLICILIFITLLILYFIWISFGESLKNVQYFCTKYLYLDYGDGTNDYLNALKWCVLNCILFSNESFFEFLVPNGWILRDSKGVPAGFVVRVENQLIISFVSTANLEHVQIATNNSINVFGFHSGYYDRTLKLVDEINDSFSLNDITEIIICGHSMAGAMAGICGNILGNRFPRISVSIYSFGSPKFCDKEPFWGNNIEFNSFINSADPVVYKPLNKNYIRVDSDIVGGKFITKHLDTGNDNVNHSIKLYREIVLGKDKTDIPRRLHRPDELLSRWFLDMLG
jgi:hypothetical protein